MLDRQREDRRWRRIIGFVRIGLEPRDQFGNGMRRVGLINQDDQRIVGYQRDRCEVFEYIVGDAVPDGGTDRHGAGRGTQQRVSIGRRLRDRVGRQAATRTGLVLDQKCAA